MVYYDRDFKRIQVDITEKISHLYNSHYVYKTLDGRCLKCFRVYDVPPDFVLDQKIQSLHLGIFLQ